ncbi:MAG: 30S ribosomal protein S3ae [Thermoplasmata archaeon]|nr:30S ribosomal protein S3ae [Thermoplasmata archaeon]MCI4344276.1 30S ribosomal protein S3ae [Thermoplasmata archaeon]
MAEKESTAKKATIARTVKDKWRSKHWFKVRAPGLFQHVELGETMASEPEQVVGRTLETTLQELSGGADIGKAHIKLRFQIERVNAENIAETRFIGHELTSDYVRRLARRKRSKIDTSLAVTTKDGVSIILKPVAVGEQRLQTHLRTVVRHKLRSLLIEEAQVRTAPEFVREMLQGDLGKLLAHGLKTLYPLKKIEIRSSIVGGPIADEVAPAEVEAPPTASVDAEPSVSPTESGELSGAQV